MRCPVCNVKLQMADHRGVEVNCCPDCRGVWIERGGLDKIIDRGGGYTPESQSDERGHEYQEHHHGAEGRRRRSFFPDWFD